MPKTDTPTVKEAFEQAQGTLKDKADPKEEEAPEEDQQEEEEVETPEKETPEKEKATEPEPESETEDEDQDLESFDPKKLPKEMQPLYKNLMKGFTQGRQKDSERAKQAEEKAKTLEERLAKLEAGTKPKEETPKFNSPEEYYEWKARKTAKEEVEKERLDSFKKQAVNDFVEFDSRFNETNETFDPIMKSAIGSQLDELLIKHVDETGSELGFPYKTHLKELVEKYDKYVQTRVQNYIKKQNELNQKKSLEAKKKNPKTSSAKSKPEKISNIREAIQAAQEKLTQ